MSYEDKILDKFADMIMPPGTIIAYQGLEAPEGFIVYDHIKIYEDEFPRLYPVLAANPNFNKGTDGDGRKWVELPEIEDLCIQMTTDTSQVGKTLEAQLPNITGAADWASGTTGGGKGSGSLLFNTGGTSFCQYGEPGKGDVFLQVNAASGNAIYGGSTLQPKALSVLPCIRI